MLEVARASSAKGNAKLVLLLLASYAHPDGTHAEMSLSTIAREAGLSRRQVTTLVHFLAETGQVLLESAAGAHGTNRYAVQRPWLKQGNHFPSATIAPGAITAPLGQSLPTIDKESKDLKKQSGEAIALGKPLPQDVGQSLPQEATCRSPLALHPRVQGLLRVYGYEPGTDAYERLTGGLPLPAQEEHEDGAESPETRADPPTRPTRKPAFDQKRFFLGDLCPAHPYGDTGQTQRRRKDDTCQGCVLKAKQAAQSRGG